MVALKLTKQQGLEAAKVLWDEARIASMIQHPNVCRVHELGEAGDLKYLVMDYCNGASLHHLLQAVPSHKLPIPLGVKIVARVAAGLHAAHELVDERGQALGVVHRDVSPQNVLVSTSGLVTVTDFGVAKALGQAHRATETGEMKGKLSYMAPEQVTSKDVDRRADIFALGCLLYQVTLGRRPFQGDDALATMYQLLEQDLVLPSAVQHDYPAELEEVVVKALAKNRDERFSSAAEFERALETYLVRTGLRVTEGQVAELLNSHLGEELAARGTLIRSLCSELDEFEPNRVSRVSSGVARRGRQGSESGEALSLQARKEPTTAPATVSSSGHRSSHLHVRLLAVAVFLAASFGGIFLLRALEGRDDAGARDPGSVANSEVASPRSPAEAPPSASSREQMEAAQKVTVEVTTSPADASIELDGELVGTGKYRATVEPSSEGHVLSVRAPGYATVTEALVLDKTRQVHVALSPEALSPEPESPITRVSPTAQKPTPGATPRVRPEPTKKPQRTLDVDNPFAAP